MEDNTKYVIQNIDKHRNDKYDDNYLAKSYVMYTNLSNAAIFNSSAFLIFFPIFKAAVCILASIC